jgi:hypothetical protein
MTTTPTAPPVGTTSVVSKIEDAATTVLTTVTAALPELEALANIPALSALAGPEIALVLKAFGFVAPYFLQAVAALKANNGGNLFQAILSAVEHMSPDQPNNPLLNGNTTAKTPPT